MFLHLFDNHPELGVFPVDINVLYAYYPVFEQGEYSLEEKKERVDLVVFKDLEKDESIAKHLDIDAFRKHFFSAMEQREFVIKDIIEQLLLSFWEVTGKKPCAGHVAKETSIEILRICLDGTL